MSISEFKEVTESIQAIVFSIGIIIGGIWAIYRFLTLKEIDKAKIELLQIQKQIEERGTIKMNAEVEEVNLEEFSMIIINVKMLNTGNRTEVLNLIDSQICVAEVKIDEKNNINVTNHISTKPTTVNSIVKFASISPNDEKCYPFIFKLRKGNYMFEIRVPGSPSETKRHRDGASESGLLTDKDVVLWGMTKFFHVINSA